MVGSRNKDFVGEDLTVDDEDVSDEDSIEEEDESPWFSMGTARDAKIVARKFWGRSVFIKLVGRKIVYCYFSMCIHSMSKIQSSMMVINLEIFVSLNSQIIDTITRRCSKILG